jgi:DNA-binding transcriptional LysR family regulator
MELRHLRNFVVVAEELNFSRAAERLNISQPPLSQQIQQLEKEIGVKLFNRTKRHVELTEAGRTFLLETRATLAQVEHAARAAVRASAGQVGQLIIATITSSDTGFYALLVETLREFGSLYPNVQLALRTMPAGQQVQALRDDRIHVGFLALPAVDPLINVLELRKERLVVCLPEGHPLSSRDRISWAALAQESFILPTRSLTPGFYDSIVAHFLNLGFVLNASSEHEGVYAGMALVAAGVGVTLLPSSISQAARRGVVFRETQSPPLYQRMGIAVKQDNQSAPLKSFLNVARKVSAEYRHSGDSKKQRVVSEQT